MKLFFISIYVLGLSNFLYSENTQALTISTSSGYVNALKHKNVYIFEDIPYAQPPVGYLRWKAPREIKSSKLGKIHP